MKKYISCFKCIKVCAILMLFQQIIFGQNPPIPAPTPYIYPSCGTAQTVKFQLK